MDERERERERESDCTRVIDGAGDKEMKWFG